MSKNIVTAATGSSVGEAKELMKEKRLRHLPIINNAGVIVGIVSKRDLNTFTSDDIPVEYFMSTPIDFVEQNSSVRSVILKMLEKKISSVLVSNTNHEVIGIVTTDDLLWQLAEILDQHHSLGELFNTQTIGAVVDKLALAGI